MLRCGFSSVFNFTDICLCNVRGSMKWHRTRCILSMLVYLPIGICSNISLIVTKSMSIFKGNLKKISSGKTAKTWCHNKFLPRKWRSGNRLMHSRCMHHSMGPFLSRTYDSFLLRSLSSSSSACYLFSNVPFHDCIKMI